MSRATPAPLSLAHLTPMSYLEVTSVTDPTLRDYRRRLASLRLWCLKNQTDWVCIAELDSLLVRHFDELFWQGHPADHAGKLLASLKFHLPELSPLDGSTAIPRAHRSFRSWQKAAPANQRLPMAFVILCCFIGYAIHLGRRDIAINMLFQYRTYLRPGTCDGLRVRQLVAPQPQAALPFWALVVNPSEDRVPGKTGLYDQSVLWDIDTWMNPLLNHLVEGRPPTASLWTCSGLDVITLLHNGTEHMGLRALAPCRYAMRHGGASDDLLHRRRSLLEIKRRGQWSTDTSLKRYGKESRLQSEVAKVSPATLQYGSYIQKHLPSLLLGVMRVPPPPRVGVLAAP